VQRLRVLFGAAKYSRAKHREERVYPWDRFSPGSLWIARLAPGWMERSSRESADLRTWLAAEGQGRAVGETSRIYRTFVYAQKPDASLCGVPILMMQSLPALAKYPRE
jgi:hypothetical protein